MGIMGCRVRDYMVPLIVEGELDKIKEQKAHRCEIVTRVMRESAMEEVNYTVDFAPTDRLRFDFQPASATKTAIILSVSTEEFLLYDPLLNRAERIVNLPPFSEESFVEYRKAALRNTLAQNKVYAESAENKLDKYWEIRTEPKKNSVWTFETVSYISKETKNNVRGLERDPSGKVVNHFETKTRTYDVNFPPEHFSIQPPENCAVIEYDLSALSPFNPSRHGELGRIPLEQEDLPLARFELSPDRRLFDYTERQKVLFYAERRHDGQPLLKSPISREVELAGGKGYINYAGTYTTCRWRSDGWDRLVFTSLGPEVALRFARQVTPLIKQQFLGPGPAAGRGERRLGRQVLGKP